MTWAQGFVSQQVHKYTRWDSVLELLTDTQCAMLAVCHCVSWLQQSVDASL